MIRAAHRRITFRDGPLTRACDRFVMSDGKIKILYIAGSVRSGSTILDNILGQVEGFFSVGELCYIWERGLLENWLCGCGVRFRNCALWRRVLEESFGGMDAVDARRMVALQKSMTRIRHVPVVLASRRLGPLSQRLGEYARALSRLYPAIQSVTGSRVIVDSSKFPAFGYVLETIPEIDLRVVHLIRDPRAVAHSWKRKKTQLDSGAEVPMHRSGPLNSSLVWSVWNATSEALWRPSPQRYLRLRYEDFVEDPQTAVRRILDLVGELPPRLPFVGERRVELGPTHTVSGNPNRLKAGGVELKADQEWISRMAARDKALVTAVTWPLLIRYRYPTRPWTGGGLSR